MDEEVDIRNWVERNGILFFILSLVFFIANLVFVVYNVGELGTIHGREIVLELKEADFANKVAVHNQSELDKVYEDERNYDKEQRRAERFTLDYGKRIQWMANCLVSFDVRECEALVSSPHISEDGIREYLERRREGEKL